MKALLQFEYKSYFRRPGFYIFILLLVFAGVFAGSNFAISVSQDVYKNAPYVIAYMLGLLSLLSIFFSTVLTTQILFREKDAHFTGILYALPVKKNNYLLSRFIAVASLSFLCFAVFAAGFAAGQMMQAGKEQYGDVKLLAYIEPLLVFGLLNTIFCTAVLCSIAWFSKNKLAVYVTGLFLYIAYMVTLIFSGSPLMAQGMPQSANAMQMAAIADPFGISAYFLQTANWSVEQRNSSSIPLSGILLCNRLLFLGMSALALLISFKTFRFAVQEKRKKAAKPGSDAVNSNSSFKTIAPSPGWQRHLAAMCSFTKLDLRYISKGIPFVLCCAGLLFCVAMEIYAEIEKGIRLPQKYASSGLMASTIIENFHGLCLIVILYYANEILWRSRNSNFQLIENATPANSTVLFFSKWFTLGMLIIFFTSLMVLLGIIFQWQYHYLVIDWRAYAGVYLFTAVPLMISAGIILIIQKLLPYRHVALVISAAFMVCTPTSLGSKLFAHPLLKFQLAYTGLYSDMNGFGSFMPYYAWQYLFGFCVVLALVILVTQVQRAYIRPAPLAIAILLIVCAIIPAMNMMKGYIPKDRTAATAAAADYEKKYRHFQQQAQPTVTAVTTTVDLYPQQQSYNITALYTLQNKTNKPIDSLLINFADNMLIKEAAIKQGNKMYAVPDQYSVVKLQTALLPGDTLQFTTRFSYQWLAVNGYASFNAIVQNGSFMRISRYYPTIGYVADNEISSEAERKNFGLGKATPIVAADAPITAAADFIQFDMTISTTHDQVAIGVGGLIKTWSSGNRNYYRYKTGSPIPFRFAISSAAYAVKTVVYKGRQIAIYYHPAHQQNVDHLVQNIQTALDYCETNFGPYPFTTIRFAEVSAFTKGFAATAYPATVFMAENMVFNANLGADKKQDVINELAGHELSHLWWGNNQLSPDDREGAAMLTETLAMYTELMLVKKMYGSQRVMDNVQLHLGIYLNERGFTTEQPLYKVGSGEAHISYSKGMLVMYQLMELIGEAKLNSALKNLLQHHVYPNKKAVSTDLINELYAVTDTALHDKIDDLFKKITLYRFTINNARVKKQGTTYVLTLQGTADKFYEDGKGKRTKAVFNDSVEVAVTYPGGKQTVIKVPVVNNTLSGSIVLDDGPVSVLVDPALKFIPYEVAKPLTVAGL